MFIDCYGFKVGPFGPRPSQRTDGEPPGEQPMVTRGFSRPVFCLQVFAVRSGGATGVVVKGPDNKSSVAFRYIRSQDVSFDVWFCVCREQ